MPATTRPDKCENACLRAFVVSAVLGFASFAVAQPTPSHESPRAVARVEVSQDQADLVTLHADGSIGEDLLFKWIQICGPKVTVDDTAAPAIRFGRTDAGEPIEFLLIVGNAAGVDSTLVTFPPVTQDATAPAVEADPKPTREPLLRADAGDAQVGLVGHRITLNGMRSRPRTGLAYRWLQVSGPPVQSPVQDGYVFSFIPTQAGTYRFVLVVAASGQISDPSTIDVIIGLPEPRGASATLAPGSTPSIQPLAASSSPAQTPPLWLLCRNTLQAIEGASERGESLALAFESVADRAELYTTFGDLFRELSLRLNSIVPEDPARRNVWIQQLFTPLTTRLIERLRETGLDLARPEAQNQPLTGTQKTALAELYRSAAHGFRAANTPNIPQPAVSATTPALDRQGVTRR